MDRIHISVAMLLIIGSAAVATAANGPGEVMHSECTPRGRHRVRARIVEDERMFAYGQRTVEISEAAAEHLVDVAGGDARSLLNALELVGKDIAKVKIVVNGAGASAIACATFFSKLEYA